MEDIKVQPHDVGLEEAILGCLLTDTKAFNLVEPYIYEEKVWYTKKNWLLYRKIGQMLKVGEKVDMVTVCSSLSSDEQQVMSSYWITGLATNSGITLHLCEDYAKKLYEKHLLRTTIDITKEVQDKAYNNSIEVYDVLSDAHTTIGELIELRPTIGFNMDDTMNKAIDEMTSDETNMVQSGYFDLDKLSGGMTKGEITIIGGRPGHCKTTFIINMLSRMVHKGYKVMLFNRELPNTEMIKKLICLESGKLSYSMVRNAAFGESDIEELEKTKNAIKLLYTSDKFCMFDNVKDFKQTAIEVKKFKPDVIFDDYIQLIQPDAKIDQRRLQLEKICNDYKWLSKYSKS